MKMSIQIKKKKTLDQMKKIALVTSFVSILTSKIIKIVRYLRKLSKLHKFIFYATKYEKIYIFIQCVRQFCIKTTILEKITMFEFNICI